MICFAWVEFPQYGARLIGALVKATDEEVVVVATRPRVPIEGMEKYCGSKIIWCERNFAGSLVSLLGDTPKTLFVSGWSLPMYSRFADEVHKSGGRVVAMVDNNLEPSWREILKICRFNLFLRSKYDAFLVPGKAGKTFLRAYGVGDSDIHEGLYAADSTLFNGGCPLDMRERKMLYVGQLCDRKNILPFARAFVEVNEEINGGWVLEICGRGALCSKLQELKNVVVHDFVQPEMLPRYYSSSRVFVLPSLSDHWGVVVHEAALSGCILLLSKNVGAGKDFLRHVNGFSFSPTCPAEMNKVMRQAMQMTGDELESAYNASLKAASEVSVGRFVDGVLRLSRWR